MEDALFSDDIFTQDVGDVTEEADNLNEETFGLCDDYLENNGDWEKQHAAISKLIEVDAKRLKSPIKHSSLDVDVDSSTDLNLSFERRQERHLSLSDAEEEIIENTISSLGLDDDVHYQVKTNTPTQSIAFEESHLSWTSPTRGKERRSDSLQELISPGGVWASPSRESEILWSSPSREAEGVWRSPSREGESVWMSPSRDSEDVWPSPSRDKLIGENVVQDNSETNYNGNIIQKLILGSDETFDSSSISTPLAPTPPPVRNVSTPTSMIPSAIRVEDLERELIKDKPKTPQPTIIERHSVSSPNLVNRHIPFPMLSPKELHMKNVLTGLGHSAMDINRMASLAMVNQQLMDAGNYPPMMHRAAATPPRPPLRPYYLNPVVFGNSELYQQQLNHHHKHWRSRTPHNENNNFTKHQRHEWHKELHPEKFKEIDYEEFIQMGPSKMMNVKEKKWIFKISLMSLLGGDPNTSDYYFISLITKNDVDESEIKPEDKEIRKNLEKTSQLVNYAQQQQQTKESHKPVKFKGSLGKLSITSVHHPRQIMDFSTPEHETKHFVPSDDGGKKKFMLYGTVEKMYSCLISIMDIERELGENKEQDDLQKCRIEKINELFDKFKIQLWNSQIYSDTIHFGNLMSISKGRKLFIRVFLLFNQEQSESLFISLINILPSLLKKDKEQSMVQFNDKLDIMLGKSKKNFKLKCIKLLRKIDLKTLLIYSTSILMLATLLHSLEEKSPILEWSYYVEEIPKTLLTIPEEVSLKVKPQLDHLMAMLGINGILHVNVID